MKKSKTPTFLLELPLAVNSGQANRQQAHFETARALYNALLGEALARLNRMRADPAQAGQRVPFQRPRNKNEWQRSPNCGKPMVSQSMPCMRLRKRRIAPGLQTTSMRSRPKHWPPVPDLGRQPGMSR